MTFLPFIGDNFIKEYIIPNYVGESFSALIPGIMAMFQGIGSEKMKNCNSKDMNSTTNQIKLKPKYSVSTYFIFMQILLIISILCFTALNYSSLGIQEKRKKRENHSFRMASLSGNVDLEIEETSFNNKNKIDTKRINFLLFLTFLVSFTIYGYLPGLLSYSTIPYGIFFMHLSINLSKLILNTF